MWTRRSFLALGFGFSVGGVLGPACFAASRSPTAKVLPDESEEGLIPESYRKQLVRYDTPEHVGLVVIDPSRYFLYRVRGEGRAVRYGVGVGREGFLWKGEASIMRKERWPSWSPPAAMRERQPYLPRTMPGGVKNPLGARALYLYQGGVDTLYRIHGTLEPETIGTRVSSGCIRMINEHIVDLYRRVPIGTRVLVLG